MRQIEKIVHEFKLDCELKRIPGYLSAAIDKDRPADLRKYYERHFVSTTMSSRKRIM